MNVNKKVSMAQRVKQKHQKNAYNGYMVSAGVSMMKENNVHQALTYDDGTVAEWTYINNSNDYINYVTVFIGENLNFF